EDRDGGVHPWGDVRVWDPPRRLVFGWHPGRDPSTAQEVDVTFEPEREGTRVRLEHRGWDLLGPEARETRQGYDSGWTRVLGLYGESLGGAARPAGR
ncbi:MAG TPA: SRPBCC domain-containing protein, partial [Longimicrobiales bacterium]|nr:SRPBCC domain-containing protein [Longimicrobiales bacterium]